MSAQAKRRIQVASFSLGDVSKGHLAALGLSATLVLGALGSAWVASVNAKGAAEARTAARLLATAATQADAGARTYAAGGAVKLGAAAAGGAEVNTAVAGLAGRLGATAGNVQLAAASAEAAWSTFGGALSDALPALNSSASLSAALSNSAGNLAQLLKSMQTSGRAEASLKKEQETALRLYSYAEAGFGAASVARVDYDLRALASGLAGTEFASGVAFVEPLLALSRAAAQTPLTREQLSRIAESSVTAKAAADSLGQAATRASVSSVWLIGAALLAVLGLAVGWLALRQILEDVGRRYHRAMQQFRAGEGDRDELLEQLRAVQAGSAEEILLTHNSAEFGPITHQLNAMLRTQAAARTEAASGARAAAASQSRACALVESAESGLRESREVLGSAVERIGAASELARLLALDAEAAASAARDAGGQAADANRMAQDAASRLDALREGLQETGKGIKRLGERTQEISSVVESLEVLAEQLGVLALNANLEAERAGEMGSGFRQVAREVQSLARQSDGALERIAALMQGAQADARAAAELVERSTAHVVSGSNISVVSQALLLGLAPLSAGVSAMTRAIAESSKEGQATLHEGVRDLHAADAQTRAAAAQAAQAREPLTKVLEGLEATGGPR